MVAPVMFRLEVLTFLAGSEVLLQRQSLVGHTIAGHLRVAWEKDRYDE
jgi:hypothetical protein